MKSQSTFKIDEEEPEMSNVQLMCIDMFEESDR